jgi:hypothetical protein
VQLAAALLPLVLVLVQLLLLSQQQVQQGCMILWG